MTIQRLLYYICGICITEVCDGKDYDFRPVEEKLNEDLEALAEATRRSKAFLITEALESYVERQSWQMQQIDAAFEKADQKGEWISNEAVETWLMSWGTDNVLPARSRMFTGCRAVSESILVPRSDQ